MIREISSASREFVRARITPPTATDPTSDPVSMAFLANGAEPDASTVWYTASWETTPVVQPGGLPVYVARALVGPPNGVVQLAIGFYGIFVKITDNPEAPVVPAGTLKVT